MRMTIKKNLRNKGDNETTLTIIQLDHNIGMNQLKTHEAHLSSDMFSKKGV